MDPVAGATKAGPVLRPGSVLAPVLWRYDGERSYTRDEQLDLVPTSGGPCSLPPDRAAEVLVALATAVDDLAGVVTLPDATWGLTAIRTLR